MLSEFASMIATSLSGRFQPGRRPDFEACAPLTKLVQFEPRSSSHWSLAFFLTISGTSGGVGSPALNGGTHVLPAPFGGGFVPPYGPAGSETALGGNAVGKLNVTPPITVLALPDWKIAA